MRIALCALATLALVSLLVRPPVPLDETRYLAVAWEMHDAGSWLVPLRDGEPYHHKPPLLFWLMLLGWELVGVHAWWPRLIPLLAAGLTVWMAARLAQRWAPDRPDAAKLTATLLAGCLAWPVYASLLLFDLLMAAWTLLGWHALLDRRQAPVRATLLLALAIAGGALTKGPVILVYLLPPALFLARRPFWRDSLGTLLGFGLGAGLALAWALPAAHAGGPVYGDALLFGQTAGRLRESFSHARPFWWYIPIGGLLLLPWSLHPGWWRSLRGHVGDRQRGLIALLTSALLFTFISGKQPHYLVPLLPPLMAISAGQMTRPLRLQRAPVGLAGILVVLLLVGWQQQKPGLDLRPSAAELAAAQAQGQALALVGEAHGQWTFLGRLSPPPKPLGPVHATTWARRHPDGLLIVLEGAARRTGHWNPTLLDHAQSRHPYRTEQMALVPAAAWLDAHAQAESALRKRKP